MAILQNGIDSCPGRKYQHLEEAGEDAADLASALDSAPTRGLLFFYPDIDSGNWNKAVSTPPPPLVLTWCRCDNKVHAQLYWTV